MSFASLRFSSSDCSDNVSIQDSNQHLHPLHSRKQRNVIENGVSVASCTVLSSIRLEGSCETLQDGLRVFFSRLPYLNFDSHSFLALVHGNTKPISTGHYQMTRCPPQSQEILTYFLPVVSGSFLLRSAHAVLWRKAETRANRCRAV